MVQHILNTSMARGEASPLASERQDLELYRKALRRLFNWFVLKHGGVRRRPGTRFRGLLKFADKAVKLVDYTFSVGQSYVLEFGDRYMRVWVDSGLVAGSSGVSPYEMVTPYPVDHVSMLQYAPYNDNIYIAHSSHHPRLITRNLSNDWDTSPVEFIDGPYLPVNDVTSNTVSLSVVPTTGSNPVATWTAGSPVDFNANDIGRHVRIGLGTSWSWGKITAVNSAKQVVLNIVLGGGGLNAPTSLWRLGAFYVGNYPSCVSFFEDRLCWAGCPDAPRTVHASYSGLPATYSPTTTDGVVTDAHGFSLEIGRSDPILWMKESSRLQLGTAGGIRSIGGASGAALTATNATQRLEVKTGATNIVPEQAGQSTVFVGRTGRRLNNMYYDYQVNGLVAPELSIVSEHLYKHRVVDMAYQETPDGIMWACDTRGKLIGTTLEQAEDIKGFSSHDVGGAVTSMAVMQPEHSDQLWMAVTRTINGATVRYMESLAEPYDEDISEPEDAFFVDCGGTYSGAPTNVISGVTWLAGSTVQLLADGARLPDVVVSPTGQITLPNGRTASKVQFGLGIPNLVATLEAPSETDDGKSLGRRKNTFAAILKLLSSQGIRIGSRSGERRLVSFRNAKDLLGKAVPLLTGKYKAQIEDRWDGDGSVEIEVEGPFPATILAINLAVESEP